MSYPVPVNQCWRRALTLQLPAPESDAPLHLIEWCVLWLIQADPRLTERHHRARLRTIMALLDESFVHAGRVGAALARVHDLAAAGAVSTRGFQKTLDRPLRPAAEAAFLATLRAFGRHHASVGRIEAMREPFFRWIGVLPSPASNATDHAGDLS